MLLQYHFPLPLPCHPLFKEKLLIAVEIVDGFNIRSPMRRDLIPWRVRGVFASNCTCILFTGNAQQENRPSRGERDESIKQ